MSNLPALNEYLEERIKFYKDKIVICEKEIAKAPLAINSSIIGLVVESANIFILELNEIVKRVNGV